MGESEFVDLDRLRELEEVMGPEDVADLIHAFLDDAAGAITAIGELQSRGPSRERSERLHYLAGAARNVGAARFGNLCIRFEKSQEGFGPPQYQLICAEFQQVWNHLDRRLHRGAMAATG